MSWLLNIDTAVETASVCLAVDDKCVGVKVNPSQSDHASWLQPAIATLLLENNLSLKELDAFAISAGPGSYTGLHVGMATAKGLCYALNIPLIIINTLKIMAHATNKDISPSQLLSPMLDARRMEVFTALYDTALNELVAPCAMILEESSFSKWLNKHEIIFFGSGSSKWKNFVQHGNAIFKESFYSPRDIAYISNNEFRQHSFSNLAYTEPIYLKDFYAPKKLTG